MAKIEAISSASRNAGTNGNVIAANLGDVAPIKERGNERKHGNEWKHSDHALMMRDANVEPEPGHDKLCKRDCKPSKSTDPPKKREAEPGAEPGALPCK